MTDRWTDRLSEYLDGELEGEARRAMEAHLATCGACLRTLDELRSVVRQARELGPVEPPEAVWAAIAREIGAAPARRVPAEPAPEAKVIDLAARRRAEPRRFAFSAPQLAAAAVVLLMLGGGSALWLARGGATGGGFAVPVAGRSPAGSVRAVALDPAAGAAYEAAVSDLERLLAESRDQLDPRTVAALEQSLEAIDRAIADARRALAEDPASEYLNTYLADRMRHKLSLLREATSIVRAET